MAIGIDLSATNLRLVIPTLGAPTFHSLHIIHFMKLTSGLPCIQQH